MHNTPKRSCSVHIVIKSISVCIWINKNNISGMPTDRSTNRQTAFDLNKETTECVIISKPCAHSIFFFLSFCSFHSKCNEEKKTHRHTQNVCGLKQCIEHIHFVCATKIDTCGCAWAWPKLQNQYKWSIKLQRNHFGILWLEDVLRTEEKNKKMKQNNQTYEA